MARQFDLMEEEGPLTTYVYQVLEAWRACRAPQPEGSLNSFCLDEGREHRLESFEAGIELAAGMAVETAGHLAHGEPEHGRTLQALDLGDSVFGNPSLSERRVDGAACLAGLGVVAGRWSRSAKTGSSRPVPP